MFAGGRRVLTRFLRISGLALTQRFDTRDMSPPKGRPSIKRALQARDAGLRRISIATSALIAGSVAATGVFTTLAAWAQPGRTQAGVSTGQRYAAASGSSAQQVGGGAVRSGVDTNLAPPAAPPVPDYQYSSPAVVSGAS